ncbi:DUF2158 domain-containing protein [Agrobacterium tumefaciens]|uniref:YodC family protein n=1 Tax=Agrobacterium tumefaciens TaxID=358 RepID=UPI000EF583EC|nr:DUF2158 domain-containing protein [Agrobacterium tumefaciens]AYM81039.1 hypothetical protein At12D1_11520 [Agrobacterium tumefaciens]NTE91728.1 DUF2158 domain-containing protein [Agrobacterium tumefaciens]
MSGTKFKAGDLVQLKAGGPKMVIEKYNKLNEAYRCSWFAGAKHNSELFTEESIQMFSEDQK